MDYAQIPMQSIGPVKITGSELDTEVMVPLATFESTVWPSTNRGAKVTRLAGGITCTVIEDNMARSICVEAPDAAMAARDSRCRAVPQVGRFPLNSERAQACPSQPQPRMPQP